MKERVFRLGMIGAGRMGRTHLRALAGSATVAVTAIAEPVADARAAVTAPDRTVYKDAASLLDAGDIDGVLIAAPSDLHLELVTQVAAAGLPILCEKPAGLSSEDVRRGGLVTARHGVPIQVGFWRRYTPALQALRDRIQRSEFGELHLLASFQWDGQPPSALFRARSGGIFRDMGVHEFDQVRWLSGQEFGDVSAVASPFGEAVDGWMDADSAHAIAPLSGGATALVSLGRYFPGGDMVRIEVFGTLDAVRCDLVDPRDGERVQLDALLRQAEGFRIVRPRRSPDRCLDRRRSCGPGRRRARSRGDAPSSAAGCEHDAGPRRQTPQRDRRAMTERPPLD